MEHKLDNKEINVKYEKASVIRRKTYIILLQVAEKGRNALEKNFIEII